MKGARLLVGGMIALSLWAGRVPRLRRGLLPHVFWVYGLLRYPGRGRNERGSSLCGLCASAPLR